MEQIEYLTVKELCDHLRIKRVTLHQWRKHGLPTRRIGPTGRGLRFVLEEVQAWFDEINAKNGGKNGKK